MYRYDRVASNPCVEVKLTSGSKSVLLAFYRVSHHDSVPFMDHGTTNNNIANPISNDSNLAYHSLHKVSHRS